MSPSLRPQKIFLLTTVLLWIGILTVLTSLGECPEVEEASIFEKIESKYLSSSSTCEKGSSE